VLGSLVRVNSSVELERALIAPLAWIGGLAWYLESIGVALVPFLLLVAWAAYAFWDEPIRTRLKARLLRQQ
jgi:hypothetical protein